jgi:hypothetical protein
MVGSPLVVRAMRGRVVASGSGGVELRMSGKPVLDTLIDTCEIDAKITTVDCQCNLPRTRDDDEHDGGRCAYQ